MIYRLFTLLFRFLFPVTKRVPTMKRVANRIEMLSLFPKNCVVAELGVFRGAYSRHILEKLNPVRLYLVDLWADPMMWLDPNGVERVTSGPDAHTLIATAFEHDDRVRLRRQRTTEFLCSCPDKSLDLVYLDAAHNYESVRDELALALPRVRPGGWIAGHDYCELFPGVISAVDEFVANNPKLKIDYLTSEKPLPVINCPNGPATMAYNSFAIQVPE